MRPLRIDDLDFKMRLDAAYRRDAAPQRIVSRALEAHRARLGHAVGDGDFVQVHLVDRAFHHFDRARRAGHDAGAQRGQIEAPELRMIELRDEHGRHAVQRGAAFLGHGFERHQRIEAFARKHHAGAVRQRRKIAQHHAEAVIERHRDAQPVLRREPHRLADEEAVVEDIVMRQRRAFGKAGRARSELDVDRLVELQNRRQLLKPPGLGCAAAAENVGKMQAAGLIANLQARRQRAAPAGGRIRVFPAWSERVQAPARAACRRSRRS